MKNTLKKLSSFLLAATLTLGMTFSANAADSTVTYRGQEDGFTFGPGSEYSDTDLFDSFKEVMPGDTRTESITFKNEATDSDFVRLYLRAVPHDDNANPLSPKVAAVEKNTASMEDFLARLAMKVYNGSELIYDASPDQTAGLTNNVFLGTVRTGETLDLRVELQVPIELDNTYANREGEVDWVFLVEAFNESQITVRKVWSDGYAKHENDTVTVHLLKDGQVEQTQELNAANGWAYTFDRLVEGHDWKVEEADVAEDYEVSYSTEGTTTTITNTYLEPIPAETGDPLDITVTKEWAEPDKNHPSSVSVTLYDGEKAVETVRLSEKNDWTYTWKDDDRLGDWQVLETSIPKGYTPSYKVKDGDVTITNTGKLIQTGQLNWPVYVLGGFGVLLVLIGMIMVSRKRRNHA